MGHYQNQKEKVEKELNKAKKANKKYRLVLAKRYGYDNYEEYRERLEDLLLYYTSICKELNKDKPSLLQRIINFFK